MERLSQLSRREWEGVDNPKTLQKGSRAGSIGGYPIGDIGSNANDPALSVERRQVLAPID
jgi:hypothetical protein